MRKHPNFILRTIKNGKIKWDNRYWKTKGDVSHIEGLRFAFGTYAPDYNLLNLWGSEASYKCNEIDTPKFDNLWQKDCELLGIKQEGDGLGLSSGYYHMVKNKETGEFVAYKSRGLEWWYPVYPNS